MNIVYLNLNVRGKKVLFPVARAFTFLPQITAFQFLFGLFTNLNQIAYIEVELDKMFMKNWKYFPECFFFLFDE